MTQVITRKARPVSAAGMLGLALGATAIGAVAIGAVAIGSVALGRLVVKKARFARLEVDELVVRKLRVVDHAGLKS